ncbi:MAG: hypothetical protein ACR2OH_04195 [Microthrixaceae bacterium]
MSDSFEPLDAGEEVRVPDTIVCVDCGGNCGLLSHAGTDDDGHKLPFRAGDVVAYRCADCHDRWDIVLE